MATRHYVAGALLSACVVFGSGAMAQQDKAGAAPGTTSGAATGTNVVPTTAAQKPQAGQPATDPAKAGSVAAGAPGVEGKPGAEAGEAVKPAK